MLAMIKCILVKAHAYQHATPGCPLYLCPEWACQSNHANLTAQFSHLDSMLLCPRHAALSLAGPLCIARLVYCQADMHVRSPIPGSWLHARGACPCCPSKRCCIIIEKIVVIDYGGRHMVCMQRLSPRYACQGALLAGCITRKRVK